MQAFPLCVEITKRRCRSRYCAQIAAGPLNSRKQQIPEVTYPDLGQNPPAWSEYKDPVLSSQTEAESAPTSFSHLHLWHPTRLSFGTICSQILPTHFTLAVCSRVRSMCQLLPRPKSCSRAMRSQLALSFAQRKNRALSKPTQAYDWYTRCTTAARSTSSFHSNHYAHWRVLP
jgi:hypothetical protein